MTRDERLETHRAMMVLDLARAAKRWAAERDTDGRLLDFAVEVSSTLAQLERNVRTRSTLEAGRSGRG